MPPHNGLVHPKQYDLKDSNVELINSALDHQVKYNSATTEPAWRAVGTAPGLYIWRIEQFEVIPWPRDRYGEFYDGDSYIVLHSTKPPQSPTQQPDTEGEAPLQHDIFFWLGSHTSQDEAGTAAYKTVELDEYLHGAATQHREVQAHPSSEFVSLFPRVSIRKGGVQSGFRHVEDSNEKEEGIMMLLRVFKHAGAARPGSLIVHEVEPTWRSLDDRDVFVLDVGDKIWVWQGRACSPMEKGKAAQVVHDLTQAKHVEVEVLSQLEARSKVVVDMLGGREVEQLSFSAPRPISEKRKRAAVDEDEDDEGQSAGGSQQRKLFRLSDADGSLSFDLVKEGSHIGKADLDGKDIFLFDDGDRLWVWQGLEASAAERALWLRVAQSYVRWLQESPEGSEAHLIPISKVVQGHESPAFMRAIAAAA